MAYVTDPALLSQLNGGAAAPSSGGDYTPASFIAQHADTAAAVGKQLGVDPKLVIAQWGLETGWGKSVIPGTNNLGNIKDTSGSGVQAQDNQTGSTDKYKQYASPADFAADQASLLGRKYPGVINAGDNVAHFAAGLHGYAEDPNYGQKLAATVGTVARNMPQTDQPGVLARVGGALASAVSGTADAAQSPKYVTDPGLLAQLNGSGQSAPQPTQPSNGPQVDLISDEDVAKMNAQKAAAAQQQAQPTPVAQPTPQPAPQPGILESAGHQLGLTARAVGHGVADAAGLVGNPLNATINTIGKAIGHDPQLQDVDTLARQFVDAHTPVPQNSVEAGVNDIASGLANPVNLAAGPIMAGAGGLASTIGRGAVAGAMTAAAQPMHEGDTLGTMTGRAAAGAIGGAAGGAAGAGISASADKLTNGANAVMTAIRAANPANQAAAQVSADDVIQQAARQQGIDLSAIPDNLRASMRSQVADALNNNQTLDAGALLRKTEGDAVLGPKNGLTLGQATRDPGQFTAEKNLRGINGAGAPLMQRYSAQNNALIQALNQRGAAAAPGEYAAGQSTIDALAGHDQAAQARVSGLYDQARNLNGGDIVLDHVPVIQQAGQQLDGDMAGAFLPANIRTILNRVSTGEIPYTLSTNEQLKTIVSRAIRSSQDGNERHALGVVRNALEGAQPAAAAPRTPVGGNQVVPQSTGLGGADLSAGAQDAFRQARAAAADRFGTIESNPALRAVVNGDAVPDNFFKRHVLNGNVGDVNSLLALVPDQGAALKAQIVDHLKQKALSGANDEVGVFSQAGYNKALNSIGDAKLHALFTPDEVASLKQIGRVSANLQAQPAGSAVNHSNTAAAVANGALAALDHIGRLPGLNLAKNSLNQFLNERAVGRAVGGQIAPVNNPGVKGSLNALLPLAAPLGGVIAAQPSHR